VSGAIDKRSASLVGSRWRFVVGAAKGCLCLHLVAANVRPFEGLPDLTPRGRKSLLCLSHFVAITKLPHV
jgi:hypothetical protein